MARLHLLIDDVPVAVAIRLEPATAGHVRARVEGAVLDALLAGGGALCAASGRGGPRAAPAAGRPHGRVACGL
jgi:hypothetical protein